MPESAPQSEDDLSARFQPDYTPEQLENLGVYDALYRGQGPRLASLGEWKPEWISEHDPKGWAQWYKRYTAGRRIPDEDERQMKRWLSFKARHGGPFASNPTPRRGWALRNWGIDPAKLVPNEARNGVVEMMDEYQRKAMQRYVKEKVAAENGAASSGGGSPPAPSAPSIGASSPPSIKPPAASTNSFTNSYARNGGKPIFAQTENWGHLQQAKLPEATFDKAQGGNFGANAWTHNNYSTGLQFGPNRAQFYSNIDAHLNQHPGAHQTYTQNLNDKANRELATNFVPSQKPEIDRNTYWSYVDAQQREVDPNARFAERQKKFKQEALDRAAHGADTPYGKIAPLSRVTPADLGDTSAANAGKSRFRIPVRVDESTGSLDKSVFSPRGVITLPKGQEYIGQGQGPNGQDEYAWGRAMPRSLVLLHELTGHAPQIQAGTEEERRFFESQPAYGIHFNPAGASGAFHEPAAVLAEQMHAVEAAGKATGQTPNFNVQLSPNYAPSARWMAEQAKQHGFTSGHRTMQDLLNTPEGQAFLQHQHRDYYDSNLKKLRETDPTAAARLLSSNAPKDPKDADREARQFVQSFSDEEIEYEVAHNGSGPYGPAKLPYFKEELARRQQQRNQPQSQETLEKQNNSKQADLLPEVNLQPHQERIQETVTEESPRMIVYHGLGSGKSLSALAAAEAAKKKYDEDYGIVAPASLRGNFQKEVEKFTEGSNPEILSYTGLGLGKKFSKPPETVIMDEAHRLRNPGGAAAQAAADVANQAKRVLLLTGSPITNSPSDLANLISIVARKNISPQEFEKKYIGYKTVHPGLINWAMGIKPGVKPVVKNEGELRSLLQGHVDYQPSKTPEGVNVNEEKIEVPLTAAQKRIQTALRTKIPPGFLWKLDQEFPLSKDELSKLNSFLTGLRQNSVSTRPFRVDNDAFKSFQQSGKLQEAYKRLRELLDSDPRKKAIIYSNHIGAGVEPYAAALANYNIPHGVFHGGVPTKQRQKALADYNAGKLRALLIGPAGAEGLSTKGTNLIQLLDPHWHESRTQQARGRGLRFDSHDDLPEELKNVHVQRFISKSEDPSFWGKMLGYRRERTGDEILERLSNEKERINERFRELLREVGTPKEKTAAFEFGQQLFKESADRTFAGDYAHNFNKFYNPWSRAWQEPSTDLTEFGLKTLGRIAGGAGAVAGAAAPAVALGAPTIAAAPAVTTVAGALGAAGTAALPFAKKLLPAGKVLATGAGFAAGADAYGKLTSGNQGTAGLSPEQLKALETALRDQQGSGQSFFTPGNIAMGGLAVGAPIAAYYAYKNWVDRKKKEKRAGFRWYKRFPINDNLAVNMSLGGPSLTVKKLIPGTSMTFGNRAPRFYMGTPIPGLAYQQYISPKKHKIKAEKDFKEDPANADDKRTTFEKIKDFLFGSNISDDND
jgi:hypothetical protein